MTRICILAAALLALAGVSLSSAGAKYEVTLESGDTYTVERVASDTFNVTDGADEPVGYLKTGGGGIQVFSAQDDLLGSASVLNPDALEIIDEHVGGGT